MAWHCKATGGYTTSTPVARYPDNDGQDNCLQIYNQLTSYGWTVNAICGLLTCIGFESGYNPWRWQGDAVPTIANRDYFNGGYGLVQWDPASETNIDRPNRNKYINNPYSINLPGYGPNYSDVPGNTLDGRAQMEYLHIHGYDGQYYRNLSYPTWADVAPTYADYITSTAAASTLCETWVVNFERPGNPATNRTLRQALATELFNWLSGVQPSQFPIWLLFKLRENNFGRR